MPPTRTWTDPTWRSSGRSASTARAGSAQGTPTRAPSGAGALQRPRVELYDNNDNLLEENDHHKGTQRAKIRYMEIDHNNTRTYYVRVSSADGGAGACTILADLYDTQ